MTETQILSKMEALIQLMQIGGITWQRKAELHILVHQLEVKPTIISSNFTEKPLENDSFIPERTKPLIPYPHWYGSDR